MIILNYKFLSYILTFFSALFLFTGCSKKNSEELTLQTEPSLLKSNNTALDIDLDSIPELGEELLEEVEDEEVEDEEIIIDTKEYITEEIKAKEDEIKVAEDAERNFWQNEATKQINNVSAIALVVQDTYSKAGAVNGWYSNNGKLTNYYEQSLVSIDDLIFGNNIDSNINPNDYELLLIKGSDIAQFSNTTVQSEALGFGVFVSTKVDNNYLICSPYGKVATLSYDDYNKLLSLYNSNHGDVVQLSSASVEYSRILNFISLFEGRFDEYFVREIRLDSKYAVVVFSSKSNAGNVRQYILRNSNDFWEVVLPDAQTNLYPITTVNKYLPDFNLNLLPGYNLATWQNNITTEQGGAIAALFQLNAIESEDDIYYLCATNSHAYIILKDGKKYCIYIENNIWKAIEVQTDREARNLFKSLAGIDYGFLVLDD